MKRHERMAVVVAVVAMIIPGAAPALSLSEGVAGHEVAPLSTSAGTNRPLPGGEISAAQVESTEKPVSYANTVLISGPLAGEEAIRQLGDLVDEAAARNGLSRQQFVEIVTSDPTARVDDRGRIYFEDPIPAATPSPAEPEEGPYPYDETFLLHSKPDSNRVIYLDFNGHTISGTYWQTDTFPTLPDPLTVSPFDSNGNTSTFSNGELDQIQSIWQRVAEDYAPFDVDVTTEPPGYGALNRSSNSDQKYGTRVVITDTPAFCACGGVAYIGVFNWIGDEDDKTQPAWVFDDNLSNDTKSIAEAVSHEAGHNVGLDHDGQGAAGYYEGHDPWAPIMGVGYYQPVVQWSKGEYTNPTNTEDDYTVMAATGLVEMDDDHTNSTGTATPLASTMTGVISSEADYDTFRYLAPSNTTATFTAIPAPVSPNLDILFRVYASDGVTLLAESRPTVARVDDDVATGLDASISLSVTKGSVYYIQVSGDSFQTPADGYSKYGSIGQYTVTASPAAVACSGLAATIVGTAGADDLLGTAGKDVISGLGGNDTITSLGGNDTICGGGGKDTLNGRDGSDSLIGGGGADVIRGGPGSDDLNGGSGNDDLFGQGGSDEFRGGSGSDLCDGGPGIDDIVSGCETIKAVP